jgi:hypothetical protein
MEKLNRKKQKIFWILWKVFTLNVLFELKGFYFERFCKKPSEIHSEYFEKFERFEFQNWILFFKSYNSNKTFQENEQRGNRHARTKQYI